MAACLLQRCCCGCGLRGGTIGISIYTLIVSLIAAAIYGLGMKNAKNAREMFGFTSDGAELDDFQKILDDQLETHQITQTMALVMAILWGISAILLLVAICSKVRWLLLPWVVFTSIFTLFSLYMIYNYIKTLTGEDGASGVDYAALGMIVGYEVLNIYFIIVIMSYFRMDMEESAHPV